MKTNEFWKIKLWVCITLCESLEKCCYRALPSFQQGLSLWGQDGQGHHIPLAVTSPVEMDFCGFMSPGAPETPILEPLHLWYALKIWLVVPKKKKVVNSCCIKDEPSTWTSCAPYVEKIVLFPFNLCLRLLACLYIYFLQGGLESETLAMYGLIYFEVMPPLTAPQHFWKTHSKLEQIGSFCCKLGTRREI